MRSFTDSKGRDWAVDLNLGAAERIDKADFSLLTEKEINFLNPDDDLFHLMTTDTPVIFFTIWCIIHPQAVADGIDQEEFKEGINGTVIGPAKEAFWGELQDFFPEMQIVLSKLIKLQDRLRQKYRERMETISESMGKKVTEEMDLELDKVEKEIAGQI